MAPDSNPPSFFPSLHPFLLLSPSFLPTYLNLAGVGLRAEQVAELLVVDLQIRDLEAERLREGRKGGKKCETNVRTNSFPKLNKAPQADSYFTALSLSPPYVPAQQANEQSNRESPEG